MRKNTGIGAYKWQIAAAIVGGIVGTLISIVPIIQFLTPGAYAAFILRPLLSSFSINALYIAMAFFNIIFFSIISVAIFRYFRYKFPQEYVQISDFKSLVKTGRFRWGTVISSLAVSTAFFLLPAFFILRFTFKSHSTSYEVGVAEFFVVLFISALLLFILSLITVFFMPFFFCKEKKLLHGTVSLLILLLIAAVLASYLFLFRNSQTYETIFVFWLYLRGGGV